MCESEGVTRVLHLISSNERRGAEVFATELADHLRGTGHDVRVMAIEPTTSDQRLDTEVAGPHRLSPRGIRAALAAARWSEVVVSFGSTSLITGSLVARATGRPFVYRNIGDPSVWGNARLAGLRVGAPLRSAAGLVALYPEARSNLIRMYGLDPARMRVIPRGVPSDRFGPSTPEQRRAARAELGLDPDRRWIGYVGALSPEKDPALAVEVLRLLPDDVGLVMAGGGALESQVRAAGADLGERFVMLGAVPDVRVVLAAIDALVLTSRTEGIPGAVIEAGLSGIPTVATAVGGVPHTIDDGHTGRLVDLDAPREFAEAVLDTLDHAATWGAAALDKCRSSYSMAAVGAAWTEVIADVARRPASRASVLQVTASSQRRGAEVFAHQLGAALERQGWSSAAVAVSGTHRPSSLPIQILGERRFRPLTLLRLLRRARRADVMVAHGSSSLLPVFIAATLTRRPFVYRVIGDPSYWGKVRLAGLRIGLPLRRAERVVALSDEARGWLLERYGLSPDRVVVHPNAVDVEAFPPPTAQRRSAARARLGLDDEQIVLGYVGSLSGEKRPDWAVRAVGRYPAATLLIAGEGPQQAEVEQLAFDEARDRVRFLGTLGDPSELFAAIDLLLLPSRTEGMPAVVIEAALSGVPTVATDVGAVACVLAELGVGAIVAADSFDDFADAVVAADLAPITPPEDAVRRRYGIERVAEQWSSTLAGAAAREPLHDEASTTQS